ncbi:MAG TPA: hypothetical protein VLQ67_11605 [Arachnia sp.]|nr:hypothetical protein [Arachnia sp.]
MMAVLDRKAAKDAMQRGGEVGPLVRQATAGGRLVAYVGDELPAARPGQAVNLIAEYDAHIGMLVQQSAFKHVWLLIPKSDIVDWGVMRRADVSAPEVDRTATMAMGFIFGPIGALLSAGMDNAAAQKVGSKPVIGIACRPEASTEGVFLDFPLTKQYRNLYDFLKQIMPDKLRE